MLRAFGLLVAISIALLLWAVRPSESRSFARSGSMPAQAPALSSTTAEPRWIDRPVPRLPELPPADETNEPDPSSGQGQEGLEPPYHTVTEAEAEPEYAPTAADEALLARAVGFLDQFLSAIESNAGDCDRMANSLSDLLSSNRDLIAEGKAMADQPTRRRWFENQMQAKAMAGAERMTDPLQGCMSSERMIAVLTTFAE